MFDIQYYKERFEQNNDIGTHASDKNNPHNVTKEQVGLGNTDDTSDINKPVSTAQQEAIDGALSTAQSYTDTKVANLVGSAPETLNTLEEVAQAIEENEDVVTALNSAIGNKANVSDLKGVTEELKGTIGYSKKQLIPYPYVETSKTQYGITFTDNGDGTVKVNGTKTESTTAYFTCRSRQSSDSNKMMLKAGTYKITGCPKDGGTTGNGGYYLQVGCSDSSGNWVTLADDVGDGATFTLTKETQIQVAIRVHGIVTVNNLVFKPMVRYASIEDEIFESYVPSVEDKINEIEQALRDYKCTIVTKTGETLSNYSESGIYYFPSGSNPTDIPVGANGWLVVIATYSYAEVDSGISDGTVVRQFWLRSVSEENSYTDICTRNIRYYGQDDWTIGTWDRVYTESYGKENHYTKSETYTKTETANLIASKSYTKSEVNSLLSDKSNKITWETVTKSGISIAKSDTATATISAAKSGYNAAGLIGVELSGTNSTVTSIYRAYVDSNDKVQIYLRNRNDTNDAEVTVKATVLYVAN